jgi:alternate signal-mediated exported protein
MNRSTKGALAASAAGALLLGGAGSLAYWNDTGTADGGSITSGTLGLADGTCDPNWVYASGTDAGTPVTLIVPGDSVTKSCTFIVTATGQHLSATLTAPATLTYTTDTSPTTLTLDTAATYDVDGVATTTVTSANDGKFVTADFVVTFPYGDATTENLNDTQGLTATLDTLTVTLTQDQTLENPS